MEKKSRGKNKGEKKEAREFEQKTIDVARVARVMEGGRRFSFRATVVVGNRNGKVGAGVAKALSVASAVEKAYASAKKNIIEFPLKGRTIPHAISSKVGASKVNLMPAKEGRGLIAGGAVRVVMELVGIKDITSKIMGSSNKINNARAAVEALRKLADSSQFYTGKRQNTIASNVEEARVKNQESRDKKLETGDQKPEDKPETKETGGTKKKSIEIEEMKEIEEIK